MKKAVFLMILFLLPVSLFPIQDGEGALPQGVVATNDPRDLPLPASGYDVYLAGESHGNQETKAVFLGWLFQLYRKASLRDVAIEEDQAYEEAAQAFVQGERNDLPQELCLRADILNGLREFNRLLPADKKLRVHLVDIDSPEQTIRQHLISLKNRLGSSASAIQIPEDILSIANTASLIERMSQLTSKQDILAGLRTVRQSLALYETGLRIHTGPFEGNPADPVREETITANLLDVLRAIQPSSVLALYGAAHVQKGTGPFPLPEFRGGALSDRLEKSGIKVYRTFCYALAGSSLWREHSIKLPAGPAASDFTLSSGGTLDDVLRSAPDSEFFYFDFAKGAQLRIHIPYDPRRPPPENASGQFDSYIFLRKATPMKDQCSPAK
jgi:hypothetical protein